MPKISVLEDHYRDIVKTVLDKTPNIAGCGHIYSGKGETKVIELHDLPKLVRSLTSKQCLCLGIVKGAMAQYQIGRPGIARTGEFFEFPSEPGFMVFDFDDSGLSMQEGLELLRSIDPALKECGVVGIYSSSSLIFDSETGETIKDKTNFHLFITVSDLSKMSQYGQILFDRTVLLGHGRMKVKKNNGALLLRSAFDRVVWKTPERELFEANPICCVGVESRRLDNIHYEPGGTLDIDKSIETLKLSKEDYLEFRLKVKALREDPIVQQKREIERKNRAIKHNPKGARAVSRNDKHLETWEDSNGVSHCYLFACDTILDEDANELKIVDLLRAADSVHNKSLPDPDNPWKRGNEQARIAGNGIAYVRHNADETMHIFSHYGDVEYHLMWDAESIREEIESINDKREIDDFITYVFNGNCVLDDLEIATVAQSIAKRNRILEGVSNYGTDSRTIKTNLKKKVETTVASLHEVDQSYVPDFVIELNAQYGAVLTGEKSRIVHEYFDLETRKWKTSLTELGQLRIHNEDDTVRVGEKLVPKIIAWNRHPAKNKFDGAYFLPNREKLRCIDGSPTMIQQGGAYNYWMGFQVNFDFWNSGSGSCEKILWHFQHIWCGGNEEIYQYLLAWFAKLFQSPEMIGQPYLGLGSEQGAGKGLIISGLLNKLLGGHCLVISTTEQLVGHFNDHLSTNVLAVLDEAIFAGDPRTKSTIKSYINEEKVKEKKGINAVEGKNYSKLIFCTNEEQIANLDLSDRRFVYLPVSNEKIGDREYFKALREEMDNGGREAFLKMMLEFETSVDCNIMPNGQSEQKMIDKLLSADVTYKFFYDLVANGPEGYDKHSEFFKNWDTTCVSLSKEMLFEMLCEYADEAKEPRQYMDTTRMLERFRRNGLYLGRKASFEKREQMCMFEKRSGGVTTVEISPLPLCREFFGLPPVDVDDEVVIVRK